jgi:NAD-dependent dihydropyrimidine dehydrogenase PreA subunit
MAYVIAEPCIDLKDKSCVNVCPVDCIYEEGEADRMLFINPDECIDCGACEAECPVAAIFFEEELPAKWQNFAALNKLYFKDKTAVRLELGKRYPV